MSWPTPDDYDRLFERPWEAFRDERLQSITVVCDRQQRRIRHVGRSAAVYKIRLGPPEAPYEIAARMYLSPDGKKSPWAAERGPKVVKLLAQGNGIGRRVPEAFEYLTDEIRWHDSRLPMTIMEWLDAKPLPMWLAEQCRRRNTGALSDACQELICLWNDLLQHGFVHGQIKPDHLLVEKDGRFRLVDSDCLCPRDEADQLDAASLPFANPYQHPDRARGRDLQKLDIFPAITILAELRALALLPERWSDQKLATGGRLVITEQDIEAPSSSQLFAQVDASGDDLWCKIRGKLVELYEKNAAALPEAADLVHYLEELDWAPPQQPHGDCDQTITPPGFVMPSSDTNPRPTLAGGEQSIETRWGERPASAAAAPTGDGSTRAWAGIMPPEAAAAAASGGCELLLQAIRSGDEGQARQLFDVAAIQQAYCRGVLNGEDQRDLLAWTRTNLRSRKSLGLDTAYPNSELLCVAPGQFELDWIWPDIRLADKCLCAVAENEPGGDKSPQDVRDQLVWEDEIAYVERAQVKLRVRPGWREDSAIVVWAVVDLGFDRVFSECLCFEQTIKTAAAPARKRKKKKR